MKPMKLMNKSRFGLVAGIVILVLIVAVAVGAWLILSRPSRPVSKETHSTDQLIIISPHWQSIAEEFERGFVEHYFRTHQRPVKLEWVDRGGSSNDLIFVVDKFSRSREGIGIDVFFGGGSSPYRELAERGLLQPCRLSDETLAAIPLTHAGSYLYDPQYRWYGAAISGFGIMFNKPVLAQYGLKEPTTWADLGHPEWFGLVGVAEPRGSGTARKMFEIMLQAYGWDEGFALITRIIANARRIYTGSSEIPQEVKTGEVAAGLAIDFYAWDQVRQLGPERIGYVMPEGLTVLSVDPIGILKGAPHPDLAEAFTRYVLSRDGQRLWMLPAGVEGGPAKHELLRMSVIPALYNELADSSPVTVDPFAIEGMLEADPATEALRQRLIADMIGATLVDNHEALRQAWKAVIDAGMPDDLVARLTDAPVTEEQGLELARTVWKQTDQTELTRIVTSWSNEARARMASVREEARARH